MMTTMLHPRELESPDTRRRIVSEQAADGTWTAWLSDQPEARATGETELMARILVLEGAYPSHRPLLSLSFERA